MKKNGSLGRRILGWIVVGVVALFALKIAFGILAGLFMTMLSLVVLALVVMGVLWALRHL
jgi:hypothetical protein